VRASRVGVHGGVSGAELQRVASRELSQVASDDLLHTYVSIRTEHRSFLTRRTLTMGLILQVVATAGSRTVRYGHAVVLPTPVWSFGLLHLSMAFCSVGTSQPFWNYEAEGQRRHML
jgi:hypothetical protein